MTNARSILKSVKKPCQTGKADNEIAVVCWIFLNLLILEIYFIHIFIGVQYIFRLIINFKELDII